MLSTEYARRTKVFTLPDVDFGSPELSAVAKEGGEPPVLSYKLNAVLLKHLDWIGYLHDSLKGFDTCNERSLEERKKNLFISAQNHSDMIKNYINIAWSRQKLLLRDRDGSKTSNYFPTYINCSKESPDEPTVIFLTQCT
jgi:hypothetical protein